MNILITGGLLGLAVLAILGAVLLGIGEERAERTRKAAAPPSAAVPVNAGANAPALLPQQSQSRQQEDASQAIPVRPVVVRPTGPLPQLNKDEHLSHLDGQIREITSELRTLAQRAGELELRLNSLSELLEHTQSGQDSVSGHLYTPETDTQSF